MGMLKGWAFGGAAALVPTIEAVGVFGLRPCFHPHLCPHPT